MQGEAQKGRNFGDGGLAGAESEIYQVHVHAVERTDAGKTSYAALLGEKGQTKFIFIYLNLVLVARMLLSTIASGM